MTLQEALDERYQEGQEEGYEKGRAEGHAAGREEGHVKTVAMINAVIQRLISENRTEELPLVAQNIEKYCAEFGLMH